MKSFPITFGICASNANKNGGQSMNSHLSFTLLVWVYFGIIHIVDSVPFDMQIILSASKWKQANHLSIELENMHIHHTYKWIYFFRKSYKFSNRTYVLRLTNGMCDRQKEIRIKYSEYEKFEGISCLVLQVFTYSFIQLEKFVMFYFEERNTRTSVVVCFSSCISEMEFVSRTICKVHERYENLNNL